MTKDPKLRAHHEWIGFLQPVGLVVSPPALIAAGAYVDRNVAPVQKRLERLVVDDPKLGPMVGDLPAFLFDVLEWEPENLAGHVGTELPDSLSVALPEYGDVLEPTYAAPDDGGGWLMLLRSEPAATDLDAVPRDGDGWRASPQARFDRILRSTGIPIGLLSNGASLRLVYAPRGESTGHVSFPVAAMLDVAGRPILAALHMLLAAERLFLLDHDERLPHILDESRKYQNQVSSELGEQVLRALWKLVRGFQAADEKRAGQLLGWIKRNDPEHLYGGFLATILRLVFVLYAEDNGLMPADRVYQAHYSVTGLFSRLRDEAGRFPDHMAQRFGAWPQLLALFRLLYDGAHHGELHLPARRGELFDPDGYPFLEGRAYGKRRVMGEPIDPPRISDGTVFRVLENLLLLKGERLFYRALDVELIGSIYEGMMGFTVEVAMGPAIAVGKDHVVVDLGKLLKMAPAARIRALKDEAGVKLSGNALKAFKAAGDVESMVAALDRRVSKRTSQLIPPEGLYLQPTEERRRSGSHYTPRTLTEPIVRTTLRPVLDELGEHHPTPQAILGLKVCDPAMGSGAFLVEACRQLGTALQEAWQVHGQEPALPPDEDLDLHARRLVAQRCLYGVDKNHFAVSLAKLSLWLVTLANEHPFTFVDHALRLGDSLVGLSREQILAFDWETGRQPPIIRRVVDNAVAEAEEKRRRIQELGDLPDNAEKRRLLREADVALGDVRLIGDLVLAAFFGAEKAEGRKELRTEYESKVSLWRGGTLERKELEALAYDLREKEFPVLPFHWEIEFPEVFTGDGFDALFGNPPFAGKNTLAAGHVPGFLDWLKTIHEESHGNADLVAHFFRRAFNLVRAD
ncbi:MAG: N-6 DNA methylase, partial [bacterium]|nr:N-6 DNA methylase [bacterium]